MTSKETLKCQHLGIGLFIVQAYFSIVSFASSILCLFWCVFGFCDSIRKLTTDKGKRTQPWKYFGELNRVLYFIQSTFTIGATKPLAGIDLKGNRLKNIEVDRGGIGIRSSVAKYRHPFHWHPETFCNILSSFRTNKTKWYRQNRYMSFFIWLLTANGKYGFLIKNIFKCVQLENSIKYENSVY